jgi:nucleotidyltransferase/DNA polymerase involved in DNA repair
MLQRKIVHIDMDAFYASVATVIDNQYLGDRASEVAKIVRQESKCTIYSRSCRRS